MIDDKERKISKTKNNKCMHCKKAGHDTLDCFKDPNPKSLIQLSEKMKGKKKTFRPPLNLASLSRFKDISYKDTEEQFSEIEFRSDRLL